MALREATQHGVKMHALEICDLCDYLKENGVEDPTLIVAAIHSFGQVRAGDAIAAAISNVSENFMHEASLLLTHLGWSDRIPIDVSGLSDEGG
jgi:hypothetical protein